MATHTDTIDVEIYTIGQHNTLESTKPTNKYLPQSNELINCSTSYMYNIYMCLEMPINTKNKTLNRCTNKLLKSHP